MEPTLSSNPQPMTREMIEKEKNLEALRESNREMERILAQLRITKIDALTLNITICLEFIELIHEMVIIFLPRRLTRLELRLNLPNLMIGEYFTAKLSISP